MANKMMTISKVKAKYGPGTRDKHCGNCSMYRSLVQGCTLVRGIIHATGVCKYWEKK